MAQLIEGVLDEDARATRDSENLAMLVDRDDYWLNSEYRQWTADPDDPQIKAERTRRKASGIKPPPRPLLAPVALRSPLVHSRMVEKYLADVAEHATPPAPLDGLSPALKVFELLGRS
ncbi:hypothetical protein [Rhodococcus marinonascens]|uniref:hypothetical protein n=1 Tax=Rhodococcus marinonascens TaxID=38311 RepID=UPI000932FDF4|nr:hypothetical protein [Rhodococcus marinonascens]